MQLTLETENPSLNICEKMSALDQETVSDKPLSNGDIKDSTQEMNEETESNGTSDKENFQNKENILSNGSDDTENHKESTDVISAEKIIEEDNSTKDSSSSLASKEIQDKPDLEVTDIVCDEKIQEENILTKENSLPLENNNPQEKPDLELTDVISAEKSIEENILTEDNYLSLANKEVQDKPDLVEKDNVGYNAKDKQDINQQTEPVFQTGKSELDITVDNTDTVKLCTKTSEEELASSTTKNNYDENIEHQDDEPMDTNCHTSHLKDNIIEKEESVQSTINNVKTLEKDVIASNLTEKDIGDSSEKDVTQSISDMVERVVQNLDQDPTDDFMQNIEKDIEAQVDQNKTKDEEKLQTKIPPNSDSKDTTTKQLLDETESLQKNENEKQETTTEPEIKKNTCLESDLDQMDIDEKPVNDFVNEGLEQLDICLESDLNEMDIDEKPVNDSANEGLEQPDISLSNCYIEKPQEPNQTSNSINCDQVCSSKLSNEDKQINFTDETSQMTLESADKTKVASDESSPLVQNEINEVIKSEKSVQINSDHELSCDKTIEEKDVINADDTMKTACSEVIDSKSDVSSVNNSYNSIHKTTDDIINITPSDVEKVSTNDTKHEVFEITGTQNNASNSSALEAKGFDTEEVKVIENTKESSEQQKLNEKTPEKVTVKKNNAPLIKLSNTLDILSDEEDETAVKILSKDDSKNNITEASEKQCINLDDDDDIMLIDEDTGKDNKEESSSAEINVEKIDESLSKRDSESCALEPNNVENKELENGKDSTKPEIRVKEDSPSQPEEENNLDCVPEISEKPKPLIPENFFKTYRKNLTDMTRDDLEEFCILKIVESIIDRSNLNEIRSKLKTMGQTIEEYKKKAMMLTKQNRDLQVVLKSVQEEQKKSNGTQPITPLKITRSVGMQVLMTDKNRRRGAPATVNISNNVNQASNKNGRNISQSPRNTPQKTTNNQTIPVPRLVPAGMNVVNKLASVPQTTTNIAKATAVQNVVKVTPPAPKPEKRTLSRMQSQSSVTVDLTDDEPPSKVPTKSSSAAPVRLVNPQNLLAPRQQFNQQVNSPRKVYIPISINGPQPQSVRPGQTIMLKTVGQSPRPRAPAPAVVRTPQNIQMRRVNGRHPAPLPDAMKQYQPPNWKALPPAPDLKLSKVENGIVISWKIEGYQEDSYEEIASYQLYAYQETSAPPNTALWKKIGDVKALPLPMACTLTQFMAGYKYYFAVRAVDIKSRLGPFSLPGSILLLNKM